VTAMPKAKPLITLTTGPRNARTDPETGLRFYTWEGREYPSVTSIRNLAGMPHPLAQWRTNQVIERAMVEYDTLGRMLGESPPKAVEQWLRKAANAKRDAAADLGKRVHDAAEKGLSLSKAPADIAPHLRWYYQWLDDSKIEIELRERQVFNLDVGYAGTFDLIGTIPRKRETRRWMVDLKTGGGTYIEHALQVEAYARAKFVGEDDERDDIATRLLQKVDQRAILHLSPTGYKFQVLPASEKTWVAFRGLLAFARWAYENPSIDSLVSQTVVKP
jgi:hypothetical protein